MTAETNPSADWAQLCLSDDSEQVLTGRGGNVIPPPEREPRWRGFLRKFRDPLIGVLLVVFCFATGVALYEIGYAGRGWETLLEPAGVLVALLLATGVGFALEVKAEREFRALDSRRDERPVRVMRRRGGAEGPVRMVEIARRNVVVGDVVRLESGDEVPADGRLIVATQLTVDESAFTGELYATKTTAPQARGQGDAAYPPDCLLRGSTVVEGNCFLRITATGMDTEEGHGARLLRHEETVRTPLSAQLDRLGRLITWSSYAVGLLVIVGRMLSYFLQGPGAQGPLDWMDLTAYALNSLMLAVTLVVMAVPEGLPMSVTMSLALSMRRMLRQHNLVRKLHACETMGAITVVCTDKTGTLTQNRLQVVDAATYADPDDLARGIALNSTAETETLATGRIRTLGNPTEGALLQWIGTDYRALRERAQVLAQEPFSTETKRMVTVARDTATGTTWRYVKGAPEVVMDMMKEAPQSPGHPPACFIQVQAQLQAWQQAGYRTLALAQQPLTARGAENMPAGPLTLSAIVAMADPLRPDVTQAINTCRDAGVRIIMVTGDGMLTANHIARQTGIMTPDEDPQPITGEIFANTADETLKQRILPTLKVLSRARPADKARLVTLLQEQGHVVAVTGDGTNDAPALKKAHVGLSMGDGTSRAKEASDITLLDNAFASINTAILWGRSLYLNIRRFILFQMTINLCACLILLAGAFIGLDAPLNVTQMLWVNLIMDTFAALALASLPPEPNVMHDPPRSPRAHIIDRRMGAQILAVGLLFFLILFALWQLLWHMPVNSARDLASPHTLATLCSGLLDMGKRTPHLSNYELSMFFTFFVLLQFWNLFNVRYFRTNRSLLQDITDALTQHTRRRSRSLSTAFLCVAAAILLGQMLIVQYGGQMFQTAPLTLGDWACLLLYTCPVLLIGELCRTLSRRHKHTP